MRGLISSHPLRLPLHGKLENYTAKTLFCNFQVTKFLGLCSVNHVGICVNLTLFLHGAVLNDLEQMLKL